MSTALTVSGDEWPRQWLACRCPSRCLIADASAAGGWGGGAAGGLDDEEDEDELRKEVAAVRLVGEAVHGS
jgi:hypothetical protein